MGKNKKLSTLIKCLNEKLPILQNLTQRRLDVYKSPWCIACKEEKMENQDHLAICKVYEESWIEIEDMSMDMAWSKKKLETRSNIMKGLVQEKAVEVLRKVVIQWEKESGISTRIKRRKRLVRLSLNSSKKDTILRGDSVRIKKSQLQNDRCKRKNKEKEEDSLEIKRAWLSSIENLIENRSKPFSYGILG
ncbi:hypothetical protein C2G38_2242508 [Gigaspora rosea]|uniref:Uncharacterized protein n=1 Tax=Gigaspora rosea TaxID=44941 RepID=A0A397VP61_9GLOM|nr:hypothetical protein C2G38_2242508 [Gigaspora rosea]